MMITDRWTSGPGAPGLVLDLVQSEGWTCESDASGNVTYTSHDGTLRVVFGPETPTHHSGGPLWTVTWTPAGQRDAERCDCGTSHPARSWTATFGDQVPAEAVAAFLTDLTGPEPLDRHRADDYLESLAATG